MDKRMVLVFSAIVSAAVFSACGLPGSKKEEPEEVIIETPTPVPTIANTPTPTPSPNLVDRVYTASDGSYSIKLPDSGWTVNTDEGNIQRFESPRKGSILVLHSKGEEEMNSVVIPENEDMAIALEEASKMKNGEDFEIQGYTMTSTGTVDVYAYTVHYLNTSKSEGILYAIYRYYAAPNEYYSIAANVKREDSYPKILRSISTFNVMSSSAISSAANGENIIPETPSAPAQESSDFTEEQLADIYSTRTIYDNVDGSPIVIYMDAEGNWTDNGGNSYRFETEQDVYDQNDKDYYWHGEAGDVAFMSREEQ